MGVFPHEHAQCVTWINYRINSCNYIVVPQAKVHLYE